MNRGKYDRSAMAGIVAILVTAASVRAQTAEVSPSSTPAPAAAPTSDAAPTASDPPITPTAEAALAPAHAAAQTAAATRPTITIAVSNTAAAAPPTPTAAFTKDEGIDLIGNGLVPLVVGGVAGSALAIAFGAQQEVSVSPSGETATATASIATGVALAFLAKATSGSRYPGRVRATIGSSTFHYWEYELAYRTSVAKYFAIEPALLVGNGWYEETERRTECALFWCFTGDHVINGRYEQMGAAMVRAVYEPLSPWPLRSSIAIGAGPSFARTRYLHLAPTGYIEASEARTGVQCDATASLQVSWLIAELGVRVGTLDTQSGIDTALFLRVGYSIGDRDYRP